MANTDPNQSNNGEVIHPFTDDDHNQKRSSLAVSYNDKIRPILDAVDKLRRLNVTQEGIPLPTIVVIGDQSSGKSSVLESLAEYQKKSVKIVEESKICEEISRATVEIAGNSKGISNVPLTLVVKKKGVPDLTMVDLPGITRVPVGDQPKDIHEQISGMIMEYIKPEESIILNVLSASDDFTTCESICMSRLVDNSGQRTLAVVTKCDQSPNGLFEKVTKNEVNIGLGYICVRNRINDETYEEARNQEAALFETHPLLAKIDKSMVGIPVLAHRLVQIQSVIISKCLPDIVKKINERLNASVLDLNKLPRVLKSEADAMATFIQISGSLKETLQKIIIQGEIDEYEDDKQMHCDARLAEMLDKLSKDLKASVKFCESFLVEEIQFLEEVNGIRLPHFIPHSVFLRLLKKKVNSVSDLPINFVNKVWDFLEIVCAKVLMDRCGNYPQLLPSMKKATQYVMSKMKAKFVERVTEMIEMEKITDYTCDPNFITSYNKLMSCRDTFQDSFVSINSVSGPSFGRSPSYVFHVEFYGKIVTKHLTDVPEKTREQAFDLKMRMTAYWNIVLQRMVDSLALQLRFFIQKVVNKEMEMEIVNEVLVHGGGIEKMLNEPPSVAKKRERLENSISLLQESKETMEQVMDGLVVSSD
ncbi:hypothetical protein M8C21_033500 [Ambrosia artemisiifolia]|uniref:Uncharacterized protein n=1 Tax=Ambrosia artemisiifolia TaxID=4212 RepID=A0AAD5BPG1_AMBAR|nr:hypothetical protein M8C21_033500 [Ambrosia artemisiifolia]